MLKELAKMIELIRISTIMLIKVPVLAHLSNRVQELDPNLLTILKRLTKN